MPQRVEEEKMTEQNQPKTNPVVDTKPNEVPIVPTDWAALGAKTGYDPKPAEALRLLIVGPSGEGKSTFEMSIPGILALDFEDGTYGCVAPRGTRIRVKDYPHFMAIIDKLKSEAKAGKKTYQRIGIDTVDFCVSVLKHQLETEKGCEDITEYRSSGYGYNLINQRLWSVVLDLEQHGYAWAFVGHLTTKQETDPSTHKEVTKIKESVYPRTAAMLKNQCDFKITLYKILKTVEHTKEQKLPNGQVINVPAGSEDKWVYYLNTTELRGGDNKARAVPTMPGRFEVPLVDGWAVFKAKYEEAVKRAKEQYK